MLRHLIVASGARTLKIDGLIHRLSLPVHLLYFLLITPDWDP